MNRRYVNHLILMKKTFTLFIAMAFAMATFAQNADFESFSFDSVAYFNGSDGTTFFQEGSFGFPISFTDAGTYTFWNGWSVSGMTDTTTPGLANQYSCIAGEGADGSNNYAVTFVSEESIVHLPNGPLDHVHSVEVNNSTYLYYSLLEGDNYAKKFGGLDGNDPDFFLLTIKGYKDGLYMDDSIDFYLADYRFDDNSEDYIVTEWTTIDLVKLDGADSLAFSLSSSDVAPWGMNTPGYFCLDNLTHVIINHADEKAKYEMEVTPNPVVDQLTIDWQENVGATAFIYNSHGQLVQELALGYGRQTLDVNTLIGGMYFLKIQTEEGWMTERFVKK